MKHMFSVAILPVLLGGCAASYPAEVVTSRDPSDVRAEITSTHHQSPLAGYSDRVPVDPKPWRRLDDDAASEGGDQS